MTEQEFIEYIKNKHYYCEFCSGLKAQVLKDGISAIRNYDGMICGGVQDMMMRLLEVDLHKSESHILKSEEKQ
jgi:hypothetical protein